MRRTAFIGLVVASLATFAAAQNKPLAPLPGPSTPLKLPPKQPDVRTPPQVPLRIAAPEPAVVYLVRPENIIFPSLLISSATMDMQRGIPQTEQQLGEPGGFLGIGVQVSAFNTPITLTISCDELMEPSTYKGTLAKGGMTYVVMPKIKWKFRELMQCRQAMPANITFKVKLGSWDETEHVETAMVRTINDCPMAFTMDDGTPVSMHFVAAAYVNENHPWVDGLLKDALDTKVVTEFTGYQVGGPDAVLQQVYAIWRVLKARGITYSDISAPIVKDEKVASQTVRFLDECIANKQANCIDGTVMFASVLRKIRINTKIVCVPGHAFLAVDLDPAGMDFIGLETTRLGTSQKALCDRLTRLRDTITKQPGYDEASWGVFEAAVKVGSKRLNDEMPKLTGPPEFSYHLISIEAARELGVQPIPYAELVGPTPAKQEPPRQLRRIR